MKLPSRWITVIGLIISWCAAFTDPAIAPMLTELLGPNAMAKIAAFGGLVSGIGRALIPPSEPPTTN